MVYLKAPTLYRKLKLLFELPNKQKLCNLQILQTNFMPLFKLPIYWFIQSKQVLENGPRMILTLLETYIALLVCNFCTFLCYVPQFQLTFHTQNTFCSMKAISTFQIKYTYMILATFHFIAVERLKTDG